MLVRIDPTTRAAAVVGPLNVSTGAATVWGQEFGEYLRMMGLAFGRDGTLYGSSPITQALYRIDPTTGKPLKIGPFGVNGVMDLAVDPDGDLWANTQTAIYRVDPGSGSATLAVRVTGASTLMGITFDASGGLWATTYAPESMLYKINLDSGAASLVGSTGVGFVHSAEFYGGR